MDAERRYRLWLAFALGDRTKRYYSLLEEFGSAENVFYGARAGEIHPNTRGDDVVLPLIKSKANEEYIDKCLNYLYRHEISTVLPEDANYPSLLKEIHLAPMLLYVKGRLPEKIELPIAVIGSRECSQYGADTAFRLAGELAASGVCVVSGLAHGGGAEQRAGGLFSHGGGIGQRGGCGISGGKQKALRRNMRKGSGDIGIPSRHLTGKIQFPPAQQDNIRHIKGSAGG